jgi:hypothetical protein
MQMHMLMETQPKRQRDPNLDNPAVMKHREIIHLRANYIQRQEIAATVDESLRGLQIWESTLVEWMLCGYSPKNVLGMLKQYKANVDAFIGQSRNGNGHR